MLDGKENELSNTTTVEQQFRAIWILSCVINIHNDIVTHYYDIILINYSIVSQVYTRLVSTNNTNILGDTSIVTQKASII